MPTQSFVCIANRVIAGARNHPIVVGVIETDLALSTTRELCVPIWVLVLKCRCNTADSWKDLDGTQWIGFVDLNEPWRDLRNEGARRAHVDRDRKLPI